METPRYCGQINYYIISLRDIAKIRAASRKFRALGTSSDEGPPYPISSGPSPYFSNGSYSYLL